MLSPNHLQPDKSSANSTTSQYAQNLLLSFDSGTLEVLRSSHEIPGNIVLPDGSRLSLGSIPQPFLRSAAYGEISALEFIVAYATAHNRAIIEAGELIKQHGSTHSLRSLRDDIYSREARALREPNTPLESIADIDALSHERILNAAFNPCSPQQRIYSVDMAILSLGLAERRNDLVYRYRLNRDTVNEHVSHMRQAFAVGRLHSDQEEGFLRAFERLYTLKLERFKAPPKLITVHDVDKTISPVEIYNQDKPGHLIDSLFYMIIDEIQEGIPSALRCPLAHHLLGDPKHGDTTRRFYRATGEAIQRFMYPDMARGMREAQELGIEIHFLTGNLHPLTEGVSEVLGITPNGALGVLHNDRRASSKPFELFSLLLDNPNSIVVMIDDSDRSLIRGLDQSSILDSDDVPVSLRDSVLFIARGPDSCTGRSHALADYLAQANIPHGRNHYAKGQAVPLGQPRLLGYQAFNQLVGAFAALREKPPKLLEN